MKYIPRCREKDIISYLNDGRDYKNVMIIEGARQVGKSRLVDEVLKGRSEKVLKLNLEVSSIELKKIDDCRDFIEFNDYIEDRFEVDSEDNFILYIDEAQESRMLGGFVRSMKEQWRRASVILTGSSMSRLFRAEVRYPVGRVSMIVIRPFSFMEFLSAAGKSGLAEKLGDLFSISSVRHSRLIDLCDLYFSVGGMPGVISARFDEQLDIREELLADIQADFYRLFDEEQLDYVIKSMRAVANITGSQFKNTAVNGASLSNIQNERINLILKRLEDWHIILKSGQNGPAPEKNYHPKRYFFDMGLLRVLRESSVPDLKVITTVDEGSRTALGGVIENYTALELCALGLKFSGWKKSSTGTEIDFIVKSNGKAYPIECKAAIKITSKNYAGIRNYFKSNDVDTGFIVSAAPFGMYKTDDEKRIYNIPLYAVSKIKDFIS